MRTWIVRAIVIAGLGFLALQVLPFGRIENPPVTQDAPWPSEEARRLAVAACYDCHSNETDWPAYSYVAPMSWLVRDDVDTGRAAMTFSEWDSNDNEAHDAIEEIEGGAMPPSKYTAIHRGAKLTHAEKAALMAALDQMAGDGHSGKGRGADDDGD
jgi:hypothetical protein